MSVCLLVCLSLYMFAFYAMLGGLWQLLDDLSLGTMTCTLGTSAKYPLTNLRRWTAGLSKCFVGKGSIRFLNLRYQIRGAGL